MKSTTMSSGKQNIFVFSTVVNLKCAIEIQRVVHFLTLGIESYFYKVSSPPR